MTTRDSGFHRSATELYDDVRANFVVYEVDNSGAINVAEPVASFKQLMLQSSQESDSEKTQIALASDAPKLYSFGRQHRFFVYQAFILDTKIDNPIEVTSTVAPGLSTTSEWSGQSYFELQDFYLSFAGLHACARNRFIVMFTYNGKRLYGAIDQLTASTDATQPNKYDVQFSFYATAVEDPGLSVPTGTNDV